MVGSHGGVSLEKEFQISKYYLKTLRDFHESLYDQWNFVRTVKPSMETPLDKFFYVSEETFSRTIIQLVNLFMVCGSLCETLGHFLKSTSLMIFCDFGLFQRSFRTLVPILIP